MRLSVRLNTLGYSLKMLIPQGAISKLTFCKNLPVVYKRWRFAKFNGKIVAGAGSTLLFLVVQTQFSVRMPRYKDEPPAVRVYTVCDESRYLIVRNVPSLGCGDELLKLFATYGDIEECKPMDAEECEAYTDVYWIKFCLISNARFAKRKLDEFVFLGNRLQVSYAPQFESLEDTKEKLETRRKEVLGRLNPNKVKVSSRSDTECTRRLTYAEGQVNYSTSQQVITSQAWDPKIVPHGECSQITRVSSEQDYFISNSMNQTVHLVRDKLDKIQSTGSEPATKKARLDNRRRI